MILLSHSYHEENPLFKPNSLFPLKVKSILQYFAMMFVCCEDAFSNKSGNKPLRAKGSLL